MIGNETTERIRNANRLDNEKEPFLFHSLSLLSDSTPRTEGGMFVCEACVCARSCFPWRFHGCASLQCTCSVSSAAASTWTEADGKDSHTDKEILKERESCGRNDCVISAFSPSNYCTAFLDAEYVGLLVQE